MNNPYDNLDASMLKSVSNLSNISGLDEDQDKEKELPPVEDRMESLKTIFKLAALPSLGAIFQPMHSIINTYYVANLGDVDVLAGYALGNMVYMMASPIGGITAQSAGTYISQAYGDGDYRMCAVYHNRQLFLNTIYYVVVALPMLFIEPIFNAIGQDPTVVRYAAVYVYFMNPVVWFFYQQQTSTVFALSQRVTHYAMTTNIIGAVV